MILLYSVNMCVGDAQLLSTPNKKMTPGGFEPPTFRSEAGRSIQAELRGRYDTENPLLLIKTPHCTPEQVSPQLLFEREHHK